jgi:hypothetical protein
MNHVPGRFQKIDVTACAPMEHGILISILKLQKQSWTGNIMNLLILIFKF